MVVEKSDLLRLALERQQAETNSLLRKLARRTDNILGIENLRSRFDNGEKIVEYQGFDPTKPDLHIGHLVSLLVHRDFQQDGHTVIFLLGGFTAMIGDPSDKTSAREALTLDQVRANSQTYLDQVGRILDFEHPINPVQLKNNYDWLSQLPLIDWLEVCKHFTLAYLKARDMFKVMEEKGEPVYMSTLQYPLFQGYDSVYMQVDMEVGGSDQYFNMLVGRDLVRAMQDREKFVFTTPLLPSSTKEKMGKTEGGAINLTLSPTDLFVALMGVADNRIIDYLVLLTDVDLEELSQIEANLSQGSEKVLEAKNLLAFSVVSFYHGEENAKAAQSDYEAIRAGGRPDSAREVSIGVEGQIKLYQLLTRLELTKNRQVARKRIAEGDIEFDNEVCLDPDRPFVPAEIDGKMLRVISKKEFVCIRVQSL